MSEVLIGDPGTLNLAPRVTAASVMSNMSISARTRNYFLNEFESDVTILVQNRDGTTKKIPGHRLVIKSGCPKFYDDMIKNTGSERCNDIWRWISGQKKVVRTKEIKGCLSSPLLTILRFCYTKSIVLDSDHLLHVLRYGFLYFGKEQEFYTKLTSGPDFMRLCKEHAWDYLRFAEEIQDNELKQIVLQVIDEDAEALFQKPSFRQVDLKSLETIVKRDSLKIREIDLFNACLDWAREQSKNLDEKSNRSSWLANRLKNSKILACTSSQVERNENMCGIRQVLEPIIYEIRFPLMSLVDFATGAFKSGILSSQEVNDLLGVILGREVNTKFNCKPRAYENKRETLEPNAAAAKPVDGNRITCKVCLDQEVSLVFVPCGHLVSCSSCAEQLTDCPVCRKRITSKIRTFF